MKPEWSNFSLGKPNSSYPRGGSNKGKDGIDRRAIDEHALERELEKEQREVWEDEND